MKPGQLIATKSIRSVHSWRKRGERIVGENYIEYKAEPDEAIVMVFLGCAKVDLEEDLVQLDPEDVLNQLGWVRE